MKGFTLIEVMISLFILLAGMLGVIKLQVTSVAITKLSGDLTYAQNLAETALQTQLARPVSDVTVAGAACLLDAPVVDFKGVTYTINCTITRNKSSMLGNKVIGTESFPAGFVNIEVVWQDLLGSASSNNHILHSYGIVVAK